MMKATGKNLTIKWWKRQKIAVQPLDRLRERVSVAAHETARFLLFFIVFYWKRVVAKPGKSSLQSCLFGCRAEALAELCGAGDSGNVGGAVAGGGGTLGASAPGVPQEPLQHSFVAALPLRIGHLNSATKQSIQELRRCAGYSALSFARDAFSA